MSVLIKEVVKELNPEFCINILDVGAIGGFEQDRWAELKNHIMLYGFEPNSEAYKDLKKNSEENIKYLPEGISDKIGKQKFYMYSHPTINSLLESDDKVAKRYTIYPEKLRKNAFIPLDTTTSINTITLNEVSKKYGISSLDFINLDCEGMELAVLKEGESILKDTIAILVDASFVKFKKSGCSFLELYNYLDSLGFDLFDMPKIQKCGFEKSPITDWRYSLDNHFVRRYGRLHGADLFFVRDPFNDEKKFSFNNEKLLKLALISECYNQTEFSFEILNHLSAHDKKFKKALDTISGKYIFDDLKIYKIIRFYDQIRETFSIKSIKSMFMQS